MHKPSKVTSSCDHLKDRVNRQQHIIDNLNQQIFKLEADNKNTDGLLEDEREACRQTAKQLHIKIATITELNQAIDTMHRNESKLVQQIENMAAAGYKIKALHASGIALVGAVVGFAIGTWWSALWTL